MRPGDLLNQPFTALRRQKLRTALTSVGVVISAFVLAASLSAGQGVQETLERESGRIEIARRVDVYPRWQTGPRRDGDPAPPAIEGEMSETRRSRLRQAIAEQLARRVTGRRSEITRERLATLAAIPHVARTTPEVLFGEVFAGLDGRSERAFARSFRPTPEQDALLVAGRSADAPDRRGVLLAETLAYRLGVVDEADVERLIGKPLRLEFWRTRAEYGLRVYLSTPDGDVGRDQLEAVEAIQRLMPEKLDQFGLPPSQLSALREAIAKKDEPRTGGIHTEELPILGVIRQPTTEESRQLNLAAGMYGFGAADAEILIPCDAARDLAFTLIGDQKDRGLDAASLLVDSEENVKAVVEAAHALGLEARAAVEFIDRQRLIYLLIFGGMTCVSAAAMLVAAIGIANTMVMSVLERTREIGIMKAVGADDRDLLFLFLAEGALIGTVGGALGLVLAWAASHPADAWVRGMVQRDLKMELTGSIFVFPGWLVATVLIAPAAVTIAAALFPARRAARIDPVTALRYE